ncbi:MAG: hypothetical protein MR883_00065, partial [Clostridiales bacterium]|nr:hypothetical protein [Clostridiales bacterium]
RMPCPWLPISSDIVFSRAAVSGCPFPFSVPGFRSSGASGKANMYIGFTQHTDKLGICPQGGRPSRDERGL